MTRLAPLQVRPSSLDFDRRPLLVFWETTRSCLLACKHCRASALAEPLPGELTREEGLDLISQLAEFGKPAPILVLTGGDVLMRRDVYELVAHGRSLGIPTCLSPSVTPMLSLSAISHMRELNLSAVSISLDGTDARVHDGIRGVAGHFEQTVAAIRALVGAGLRVQINTTVMRTNVRELAGIAALAASLGVQAWEVFFLVEVGRGAGVESITAGENEEVCHFLYDASRYGFAVRTVEAPFFRRVASWRREHEEAAGGPASLEDVAAAFGLGDLYRRLLKELNDTLGAGRPSAAAHTVATRDGKGIVFIAHNGDVYPAGFLPLVLGNVRRDSLAEIYRMSPQLQAIRRGDFSGRCGVCQYSDMCGGSRSRAFASSGDPLAEDPACSYQPDWPYARPFMNRDSATRVPVLGNGR